MIICTSCLHSLYVDCCPGHCMIFQDLAVITDKDFQVLLDELLAYEAAGKLDAIVA